MLQCELNWFLSFCAAPLCLLTCHQPDANPGNQSVTLSMQDGGFVRLSQQTDMVLAPKRVYCTADSIEITATHPGWEKSYLWELQAKQERCEGKSNAKCSCQQDKANNKREGAEGHRIQELDTSVKGAVTGPGPLLAHGEKGPRTSQKEGTRPIAVLHKTCCRDHWGNAEEQGQRSCRCPEFGSAFEPENQSRAAVWCPASQTDPQQTLQEEWKRRGSTEQ